ncbi:hypothetical protein ATI61_11964 [Archangium gephyra]|uniref:Uncharacterized protein n=1 Tax=Archangium gephyra TaxID=48 RepID=A0ABX9JMH2_9BACT|nr:hypothetical protein [Archangium gephyra]REG22534.1 hypothetical protein ATI61_11964 [Archangium gephyra]
MFKIDRSQVEAFKQNAMRNFESEMVEHLKEFAPEHFRVLRETGIRGLVKEGIERAVRHGLTHRGPVRLYIELMVTLGSRFDTDPYLPWARETLEDARTPDQTLRSERLFDAAMDYLERVAGPQDAFVLDALHRVNQTRIDKIFSVTRSLEDVMATELDRIYPQKCKYLGEQNLRSLIRHGHENARCLAAPTSAAVVLVIGLMFFLGHGFASDPLFPWIAATLDGRRCPDPGVRFRRLHIKTWSYMRHVLEFSL